MQDEVAPPVPARRGKKPTAPDHIKVYKTAVFKIHSAVPSPAKGALGWNARRLWPAAKA